MISNREFLTRFHSKLKERGKYYVASLGSQTQIKESTMTMPTGINASYTRVMEFKTIADINTYLGLVDGEVTAIELIQDGVRVYFVVAVKGRHNRTIGREKEGS